MRPALALVLLASCSVPGAPAERVRLIAKLEAAPPGTRVNAYDRSADQRSTVSFKVLRVLEGSFPDPFIVCTTQNTALLKDFIVGGSEGSTYELTLYLNSGTDLWFLDTPRRR